MRPLVAPLIVATFLAAASVVTSAGVPDGAQTTLESGSLEGARAPRLDGRLHIGPRVPTLDELKGKVVLLFFWAHWCAECRAESATIAKLLDRYRSQGLVIVAPTERYGFVEGGRPAPPDKELRHIIQIRDSHYAFLRNEPVPIGEANHKAYGAESVPLHVLIDREGIVRYYHPGRLTEEELEGPIRALLATRSASQN
jgi:thiol-disulfide isomerase/thioredoxin